VPYHLVARQTKHHPSGRRVFPSGPFTVSRSFCSSFHPYRRLSSPFRRPSVFDQASDSFQIYIWEDCCNRPDDVDFRPDALLLKARIAIQIQPCGRLLAWSRRTFNRYGNCGFDFNRSDAYLSWSGHAKPFMEITCSGRATVWTTVSHRPDEALKKERFSVKISKILVAQLSIQTAHVRCPNGAHIFYCNRPFEPQPINRGPWALRIARIRYWIPSELRELFVRLSELTCLSSHCKCDVAVLQLKSILGVSPKVKDSIEDPFR